VRNAKKPTLWIIDRAVVDRRVDRFDEDILDDVVAIDWGTRHAMQPRPHFRLVAGSASNIQRDGLFRSADLAASG
jgi:hypothetical protein